MWLNTPLGIALIAASAIALAIVAALLEKACRLGLDRSIWKLKPFTPQERSSLPSVTVIVPARNEEKNIAACVESILSFDYPEIDLMVIDDASKDRTLDVCQALERASSRKMSVVESLEFDPAGREDWACAKSYVLWHAAQRAQGEWILFLDSDTRQRPDGLWRAIKLSRLHHLRAFSASGIYTNPGFWGDILECLMYTATLVSMPLSAINDPARKLGWLNGQFILIQKSAYFDAGGHLALKNYAFDDLSMGRRLKEAGIPYRFLPGAGLFHCVNYVGFRQALNGWARLLTSTGWLGYGRLFFAIAILAIAMTCLVPTLALGIALIGGRSASDPVVGLSGALVVLLIAIHAVLRAEMRSPAWRAIFLPVAGMLAIATFCTGYWRRFHSKRVDFRGRPLPVDPAIR